MLNHYETAFILTPVLSDVQMKEAVAKFEKLLVDNGATIINHEEWGLKKLAYPIQKKSTGFYALLQFDAEPEMVNTLETAYRRDERVLRFLTFKLDKYAYEYALKRMNGGAKKEAPVEEEPVVEEAPVAAPVEEPAPVAEPEVEPVENKED